MKVKELIRQLHNYDPEARVYLESYMGEGRREALCSLSYMNGRGPKAVILEDASQFDVGEEIGAMLDMFSQEDWDETDAYQSMVDRGYTPDVVAEYYSEAQAEAMRDYCERHGIE